MEQLLVTAATGRSRSAIGAFGHYWVAAAPLDNTPSDTKAALERQTAGSGTGGDTRWGPRASRR